MTLFKDMAPSSRLWIYQANKELSAELQTLVSTEMQNFVDTWQAHRQQLLASFELVHNYFLMFAVDEAQAAASGCSIDSSVHFIQQMEDKLGVSFLNRNLLSYRHGNEIAVITRLEFRQAVENSAITENTIVFNNLIQTVAELDRWEVPMKDSWHQQAFVTIE